MIRPAVIIAEPEPANALSVRKIVVETAKFNVLTVHSTEELRQTMEEFPAVRGVILHQDLANGNVKGLTGEIKQRLPEKPLIMLSSRSFPVLGDYHLDSHDPEQLIALLRELFGDPREMEPNQEPSGG
jgi:hypothetical protein